MSDESQSAPLNLDRFSEALRRRLYERVVQIQFSAADSRRPDEAALQILCIYGRWFAFWTDPEEPRTVAAHLRTQIVRIQVSPSDPAEIVLDAV
jgi:hypothetical protein